MKQFFRFFWNDENGQQQGTNIALLIIGILILFLIWRIVWPGFKGLLFEQEVESVVNYDMENSLSPPPPDAVKERLLTKARRLKLPIKRDDIKLYYRDREMEIKVDYSLEINLVVFSFTWSRKIDKRTDRY